VNALLQEKRSIQHPVGLPGWLDKVRLQPTVAAILDVERPASIGKGDQLIMGALEVVLIKAILAGRLQFVHDTTGMILGSGTPPGKSLPSREVDGVRKPPARAASR